MTCTDVVTTFKLVGLQIIVTGITHRPTDYISTCIEVII